MHHGPTGKHHPHNEWLVEHEESGIIVYPGQMDRVVVTDEKHTKLV